MISAEVQHQAHTESQQKWVLKAGTAATAVGLVVAMLIPLASTPDVNWLQSAALIVYMLASMAVSGIAGFIFAVPRARPEQIADLEGGATKKRDARTVRFEANSNLEQISDWLTKILVGAGLVQLAALPAFLRSVGSYLGAEFGPVGPPIAVAFVLYGVGIGFLVSYLWTRLRFRVILEITEREAQQQSRANKISKNIADAEKSASTMAGAPTSETAIDAIASEADRLSQGMARFAPVLWVDDHPENNLELIRALEETGVQVDLAVSTDQALRKLSERNYGVVITDAGRNEAGADNPDAGLELLRNLDGMSSRPRAIVYTGYRGMANSEELKLAGAIEVTMSPATLFQSTIHALVGAE